MAYRPPLVRISHKLNVHAPSNGPSWSPGAVLLNDARKFQTAVRQLMGLWRIVPEVEIPRGPSWQAEPYRAQREVHDKARKANARHHWRGWEARTDEEWYTIARTAAHVAYTWRLVERGE